MSGAPIQFYFDFISPFAYLGWTQIHAIAERHQRSVEPVPVLFAALLNAHGHKGPAEIPPKRVFTWKTVVRLAHDLSVPVQPPPAHPFNPLLALRVASLPLEPSKQRALIDRLFRMTWTTGRGVDTIEKISEALSALGHDAEQTLEAANAPENKARLKTATDEALKRGVFGVPTAIVDDESFWGQDSFGHMERFMRGEDPVDPESIEVWAKLPVGIERKKS
ncbi:MAG: 2-hydroxychromene-2-carboxylate isomerase [Myxococcota bacterium]